MAEKAADLSRFVVVIYYESAAPRLREIPANLAHPALGSREQEVVFL
jgi:hypothetical protein